MDPNDNDNSNDDDDDEAHTLRDFLNTAATLNPRADIEESPDRLSALSTPCESPPSRQSRRSSASGGPTVASPVYDRHDTAEMNSMASLVVPRAAAVLASLASAALAAPRPQWMAHEATGTPLGSGAHTPVSGGGGGGDLASIRRSVRKGAKPLSRSRAGSGSSLGGMMPAAVGGLSRHWSAVRTAFASGTLVRVQRSPPMTPQNGARSTADKKWDMLCGVIQEGIASARLRDVLEGGTRGASDDT